MDQTPTPPESSVPQPPVQPPTPPTAPPSPESPRGSSKLALWSMILGIVSVVLAVVIFISIPAAIVAIILGIVALVKHRPGKGKSIAGVITGGVALFIIIPFMIFVIAVTIAANNGLTDRANQAQERIDAKTNAANQVATDCYSYTIPTGYEYDDGSKACHTAVNIPEGDALTRVQVKGTTGTIGTLSDVVARYNSTLSQADPNTKGIIDQEQFTVNGKTVYYVSYEDTYKLLTGIYIVNDPESTQAINGEPINAYSVLGYAYNSSLKGTVRGVVDSLVTK